MLCVQSFFSNFFVFTNFFTNFFLQIFFTMTITEVYYLFFNSLGWITIVTTVIISTLLVESWSNLPHVG